ncbi:helix-turn-helix transcriptional regulator [Streptomyces sp. NPDC058690]|uniref:helix-turn-helix transcriptional regulator n=1 Tax=Streptomyces sp. NPDC058690 TaxID=3346600 RepID=UPI0036605B8E
MDPSNSSSDRDRATAFTSAMNLSAQQIGETGHIFAEWEDGPFAHLKRLAIPEPDVTRGFKFAARGHLYEGLLSVKVYCDSLAGLSGSGMEQDPIVADLVSSGALRFAGKYGDNIVGPGQVCIRDARASWQFVCAPGTRIRMVAIPRLLVFPLTRSPKVFDRAYVADSHTPEVRFLMNFLQMVERSSDELDRSVPARNLALDACAALLSGMLSGRSGAALSDHPNTTVEAAKNVIENDLGRDDLSPAMIAQVLGVSLRTLHRSFADSNDSIMAFTRRRRLQKAHDELIAKGGTASVSEIAARWHFADSSHFIRHFKSAYGTTPAAYLRSHVRAEKGFS